MDDIDARILALKLASATTGPDSNPAATIATAEAYRVFLTAAAIVERAAE